MERRQSYLELIAVIRFVLRGDTLPDQIHWEQVVRLAARHHLVGVVYRAISISEKDVPPALTEQVESAYFATVGRQIRQDHYTEELFSVLDEREIPYLPLQGYCLRELYPQPNWRAALDLDLLVPEENRGELREILEGFGFHSTESERKDLYLLDQVCIDVHFSLHPDDVMKEEGETLWESLVPSGGASYRFSPAALTAYQLSRMRRNYATGDGIGIRSLLDLFMCEQPLTDADRSALGAWAKARGIEPFVTSMENLAEVWFGDGEQTNDTMLLGSYIAAQGNTTSVLEEEPQKRGTLRRIFPPFRMMKRQYPCLKYFPPLLPLLWVVRWFALLLCGSGKQEKAMLEERSQKMLARVRELTGIEPPENSGQALEES